MSELLRKIKSPDDLKSLPDEVLPELCTEIRNRIVSVISSNGGHLGGPLGVVELTVALLRTFDLAKDKLVWDVGHQCYAHKILTGRNDSFDTIRSLGGISGFPRPSESEYDHFGVGHSSTSISAAFGLAVARDLRNHEYEVVAVIGDGALTGGLAYEGLNNAGASGRDIIVVLNDNSMSISKNVGAIATYLTDLLTDDTYNRVKTSIWELTGKLRGGENLRKMISNLDGHVKGFLVPGIIFEKLGFRYFGPVDGHDVDSLLRVFGQIKKLSGPRLVHVVTQKGKGYPPAEEDDLHFHGVSGFNKETGKSPAAAGKRMSYTDVFGETIVKLADADRDIVAVTPAMLAGSGLAAMKSKYPDRVFDVGIAEGHAGTFSAGLAASGLKPVFVVYSTFLQRAFDQVIHDIALQKLPVVICIDRSGLVGEDGPTHHGSFDISYLSMIPHFTICAPRNGSELAAMMSQGLEHLTGPIAIRYPRGAIPEDDVDLNYRIDWGRWETLRQGSDTVFLACGSMVQRALGAADILLGKGVNVGVVNCRFIKPLDEECLAGIAGEYANLITLEENSLIGGFGAGVSDYLNRRNLLGDTTLVSFGLPDKFVGHGSTPALIHELKLDPEGLAEAARKLVSLRKSSKRSSGKKLRISSKARSHERRENESRLKKT